MGLEMAAGFWCGLQPYLSGISWAYARHTTGLEGCWVRVRVWVWCMEMEMEMYGLETYAVSPSSPLNHEAIAESYAAEVANARAAQRRRKPSEVQPSVASISAISSRVSNIHGSDLKIRQHQSAASKFKYRV